MVALILQAIVATNGRPNSLGTVILHLQLLECALRVRMSWHNINKRVRLLRPEWHVDFVWTSEVPIHVNLVNSMLTGPAIKDIVGYVVFSFEPATEHEQVFVMSSTSNNGCLLAVDGRIVEVAITSWNCVEMCLVHIMLTQGVRLDVDAHAIAIHSFE